jgi:hypothetical protein
MRFFLWNKWHCNRFSCEIFWLSPASRHSAIAPYPFIALTSQHIVASSVFKLTAFSVSPTLDWTLSNSLRGTRCEVEKHQRWTSKKKLGIGQRVNRCCVMNKLEICRMSKNRCFPFWKFIVKETGRMYYPQSQIWNKLNWYSVNRTGTLSNVVFHLTASEYISEMIRTRALTVA